MQINPDLIRRILIDLADTFPASGKTFLRRARKYASKGEIDACVRYLEGHDLANSGRTTATIMGTPFLMVDLKRLHITSKGLDLVHGVQDPISAIVGSNSVGTSALRTALDTRIRESALEQTHKDLIRARLSALPHLKLVGLAMELAEIAAKESPRALAVTMGFVTCEPV
ncbi:hypothetical protein [Achromobacter piechaudii]|uniref:hypothetical protein n=1 Tax=Achromobacter piechaudii TaxID=72556 RepID=UPI003DA8273E